METGSCAFCKILAHEIPASFVYEDKLAVAFMDLHPVNEGHVLVIPRQHCTRFTKLSPDLAAHMFTVAHRVLKGIEASSVRSEGANLTLSDGATASQDVLHTHLHITPRFAEDGKSFGFAHLQTLETPRDRLDEVAKLIRSSILKEKSKDPLAGMTLEKVLGEMVDELGWDVLGQEIPINCFIKEPSLQSSLKFLRKTEWARRKVEQLYTEFIAFKAAKENEIN